MKITKLLLFSIAVLLFACGDDDDFVPTSQGMVGAWQITGVDYKGTTTTTAQGLTAKADFTGTGKDMTLTSTFNASPNTVTTTGSYTIVLKTTIAGQTETEEYTEDELFSDGTWTLDGATLTITDSNGPQKATIIEQTATSLKIKVDVNESETEQGITMTTKVTGVYSFKKK